MPSVPSLIWDAPRNPYLAVGIPLVLGPSLFSPASPLAIGSRQLTPPRPPSHHRHRLRLRRPRPEEQLLVQLAQGADRDRPARELRHRLAYRASPRRLAVARHGRANHARATDLETDTLPPPPPTQLYALSGFGSYVVAQNLDAPGLNTGALNPSARNTAIEALNLYWVSLGLNLAWSPLFFGLQRPALALADIVALTGVVGALTVKAHSLPKWNGIAASLFFAPYAAWTLYATYLNGGFYLENYSLSGTRRTPKAL